MSLSFIWFFLFLSLYHYVLTSQNFPTLSYWNQLSWARHVSEMGNHCLPRMILCHKLSTGHRHRGPPKNWFKGCLKKSFRVYHINHQPCWEPWRLLFNHQPFSLLLWKYLQGSSQRQMVQYEKLHYYAIKTLLDLQPSPLWLWLPVPHQP